MAKKVTQLRYYDDMTGKNEPYNATGVDFINGTVFNSWCPIVQLGIQTLPGTKFYLNEATIDPVIIGQTGIYELDLSGGIVISSLRFDQVSIETIKNNPDAYLIVDILCDR